MEEKIHIREILERLGQENRLFKAEQLPSESLRAGSVHWDHRFKIHPAPPSAHAFELLVEARARISPQVAFALLPRLREGAGDAIPAICSPVISPRVASMCREGGVSYFDADGNAFLRGPGLLVHILGRPRHYRAEAQGQADPFAPKSSRIVRTLLSAPGRTWGVLELGRVAGVSNGLASRIKDVLVEESYALETRDGLRVRRPRELLQAWQARYQPPGPVRACYMMATLQEVESRVVHWCNDQGYRNALAMFSGAARVAPVVRYNRAIVYMDVSGKPVSTPNLMRQLELKEVETGSNLGLVFVNDPAIFSGARELAGAQVVSPLQLYLDLSKQAGRGAEAAEEVFERELRPLFDRAEER